MSRLVDYMSESMNWNGVGVGDEEGERGWVSNCDLKLYFWYTLKVRSLPALVQNIKKKNGANKNKRFVKITKYNIMSMNFRSDSE